MKPPNWDQINTLLEAALTLPAEEREAYLQAHCQGDAALLREVRSLLQAHEEADSFLEKPAHEYAGTLLSREETAATDPLLGQTVDHYHILEVLGQGGMGVVYKARNLMLDRIEALKIIAPFLIRDDQFLRRFRLEAQTLAKIHHPNIVTIYTLQQAGLGHYITMEYVEGRTLADVLAREKALAWPRALPMIKQLLSAFAYAHKKGVIHRDIKPRNIMLTPGGEVKVMDFGLAKFYQRHDLTQTQGVSGTPYYMSPEQIKGAAQLDQRSDIFSIGMTLYETLSGQLPFDKNDSLFSIQRSIVEGDFPALYRFNKEVPAGLSAIVMTALQADPQHRYQYAGEMLEAVEAFEREAAQLATVPAAGAATPKRPPPAAPLKRWGTALALLVLTAGLGWGVLELAPGLYTSVAAWMQPSPSPPPAEPIAEDAATADPGGSGLTGDGGAQDAGGETTTREPEGTRPARDDGRGATEQGAQPAGSREDGRIASPPPTDGVAGEPGRAQGERSTLQDAGETAQQTQGTNANAQPSETPVDTAPEEALQEPALDPAAVVQREAFAYQSTLKASIMSDEWSGVPAPLAAFYKDKFGGLSSKFEIKRIGMDVDDRNLRTEGTYTTLPVTVYVDYQQRGRDKVNTLRIPAKWTWAQRGDTVTLISVQ